jgi:hypothetical protein
MTSSAGPDGDPAFFSDYINNPTKRYKDFTTSVLPPDYWENYSFVYVNYKAAGKIIFRSKHVDANNHLHVTQVWTSQTVREEFLAEVDAELFNSEITIPITYDNYEVTDTADITSLVNVVMSSNDYVIQICAEEFRVPGMVIGDPLKGDVLFTVE